MKKLFFTVVITFLFLSCQKNESKAPNVTFAIRGVVQKGPFIQGSEVRIQELTNELISNGNTFFTETNDDFGSFTTQNEISEGYVDVASTGFYFNEIEGKLSASQITLKCLNYLHETRNLNLNILTSLSYNRLKYLLINENMTYDEAEIKVRKEVLKMFYIEISEIGETPFDQMDISKAGLNNSILLAISSILQYNNSEAELSELLVKMGEDIQTDGILNNEVFKNEIRVNSMSLDIPSITENLIKRYEDLGLPGIIPDFGKFIDSDGDGVINSHETSNPVFSLLSGTYINDTSVSISVSIEGAYIYYTLDGSDPDTASLVYQNPIIIAGDSTHIILKAIAKHPDLDQSEIITADYLISYPVIRPYFFPASSGSYSHDLSIAIHCEINSNIYYTTDGTVPDIHSTRYQQPVDFFGDGNAITISAIAIKQGYHSEVVTNNYSINYDRAAAPNFNTIAGTYNHNLEVRLSSPTGNAIIYYTVDGTVPTMESQVYTSPFVVENDGSVLLIKAIAKSEQSKVSPVSASYYRIDYSYDSEVFNDQLSIIDYQNDIVGRWIGFEDNPWRNPYNVEVTFKSDGTVISNSLTPGEVAFYYGNDNVVNTYTIFDLNSDGSAMGTMVIFGNQCTGGLRYIKFSPDLNVLTYEFWHFNEYGPIKHVLTRVE
jgi:hypothetical protein